jgi:hypothetical protein
LFLIKSRSAPGPTQLTVQLEPATFPCSKASGREAYCSSTSSAEVRNEFSYTSTPPIFLHDVYKDFTFSASVFLPGLNQPESEAETSPPFSALKPASLHGA